MNRLFLPKIWIVLIPVLLLVITLANAQDEGCPADVRSVLQQSGVVCAGIGSNQVCYGNIQVTAASQPQVEQFQFERPGDRESVTDVKSLYLSAMDVLTNTWGIAHMRLSITTSSLQPGEANLVLFGDVEVTNLAEDRESLTATVTADTPINVRQYPHRAAGEVAVLNPGDTVLAIGRLDSSSWLRVEIEEPDVVGWLAASLVTVDGDISLLKAESAGTPFYRPMQAFLYASNSADTCANAPVAGLLIQTPEGQARISFLINEVSIDLISSQTGSTALVQSPSEGEMFLAIFDGTAIVTDGNNTSTVIAGSQITISDDGVVVEPLDETLAEGAASLGVTDGVIDPATWQMILDANQTGASLALCSLDNSGDTDGDGVCDIDDRCPADPTKTGPGLCGCGVPDTDTDGEGTPDCNDRCPTDPTKIRPGQCGCGVPDTDSDGDGTANCRDSCPTDPTKIRPGQCGCGVPDTDSDGDGTANCLDSCPVDPTKIAPGQCGCGVPDTDSDGDSTPNCLDSCPADPTKIAPGQCGCGVPDTDSDSDGTADCNDLCPADPLKTVPGNCGCGNPETCIDLCPADPLKTDPGFCGCGIPDTDGNGNGFADCVECGDLTDNDGDGFPNCNDFCPGTPGGYPDGC